MYAHFTANNTRRWIDILPKLLETYNKRWHRSIKMAPLEVNITNEDIVYKTLFGQKAKYQKPLDVGTNVRISKYRNIFAKGYLPNFTEEVFKIKQVLMTPLRYKLEDFQGEPIKGTFVRDEIQPVIIEKDKIWKIEKVISKKYIKGKGYMWLVKWLDWDDKFNSYVNESDLISFTQ